jgi:HPt (histidine-containing phosphotransfer) domain-containing protein
MLTANAVAGQREMFLKNGISDFLAKPIDVRKLNIILETWIPQDKQEKGFVPRKKGGGPVAFPVIQGVDISIGLPNAGDSIDAYKRILSLFCSDIDERLQQIRKDAAEGNYPSYITMVHAIKGAARSIGAVVLGEQAAELEAAGRSGTIDLITEKTEMLLAGLGELTQNIRAALGSPGDKTESIVAADLGLDSLKNALNAMDTAAVDAKIAEIRARPLNHKTREYMGEIEQHVLLFEYGKAVEMIDKVLGEKQDYSDRCQYD